MDKYEDSEEANIQILWLEQDLLFPQSGIINSEYTNTWIPEDGLTHQVVFYRDNPRWKAKKKKKKRHGFGKQSTSAVRKEKLATGLPGDMPRGTLADGNEGWLWQHALPSDNLIDDLFIWPGRYKWGGRNNSY